MYRLRGHHLLCLLGYRGMGYSDAYVEKMTSVYSTLNARPDTEIELVEGPDTLCAEYPCSDEYHCENVSVYKRDHAVLEQLGLTIGQVVRWDLVLEAIRTNAKPSDIATLCQTCSWRSYGVCEEGIRLIRNGRALPDISSSHTKDA